jgi:hypothetical protein
VAELPDPAIEAMLLRARRPCCAKAIAGVRGRRHPFFGFKSKHVCCIVHSSAISTGPRLSTVESTSIMLFHLSALSVIVAIALGTLPPAEITSSLLARSSPLPALLYPQNKSSPPVVYYFRARLIPLIAPYLPTALGARLSNYTPLSSFSFSDQAAAGMSSRNFDLEQNLGEGSSENRLGLDEGGVEEVRRIM